PDLQPRIPRRPCGRGRLRPGAGKRGRGEFRGGVRCLARPSSRTTHHPLPRTEKTTMPNRHRGEISAILGGRERVLVLTLGALTELESRFGVNDLMALAERLSQGRLAAREAVAIIGAGLRGAGESITDDEVAAMPCDGG